MENQEVIFTILGVVYGYCMFCIGYIVGHADGEEEQ
jgi:hypothetical protein